MRLITLFNDPTQKGFINQRYVCHMLNIAHDCTELNEQEFKEFLKSLLLVAKKLVATWRHLNQYIEIETKLIEDAEKNPPIETLDFQHLSYSQDLFLELDEFLVQMKSTLDYLAKLPRSIIGKRNWPDLRTFGDKGGSVVKALRNNIPKKWESQAKMINEMLFEKGRPWLEMAITARDKINHYKDGGLDYETFIVTKTTVDGKEKVIVPIWVENVTLREYMQNVWRNLFGLVEQFTVSFLSMRFKSGYGFLYIPTDPDSIQSPIQIKSRQEIFNFALELASQDKKAANFYIPDDDSDQAS